MPRKKKIKDIEWLLNTYKEFYQTFGIEEENIRSYYDEWKQKNGERIEDFAWHIFNTLLHENAAQSKDIVKFYKGNRDIYLEMWRFRKVIEGKDANEFHKLFNQTKVRLAFEETNLRLYVKTVSNPDCPYYSELQRKKSLIENVIKEDIVPFQECTRERGCTCSYVFEPIRDSEGSLIRKKY